MGNVLLNLHWKIHKYKKLKNVNFASYLNIFVLNFNSMCFLLRSDVYQVLFFISIHICSNITSSQRPPLNAWSNTCITQLIYILIIKAFRHTHTHAYFYLLFIYFLCPSQQSVNLQTLFTSALCLQCCLNLFCAVI
jgi:hypothetical protein